MTSDASLRKAGAPDLAGLAGRLGGVGGVGLWCRLTALAGDPTWRFCGSRVPSRAPLRARRRERAEPEFASASLNCATPEPVLLPEGRTRRSSPCSS